MRNLMLLILFLLLSSFAQASDVPVVAITSPDNPSTFTAGSDITVLVTATETDGNIASVTFYNGLTLLGQSHKSPYSFTWANVPVGTYTLTAVATDINEVSTTSSAVKVTVTPAPPLVVVSSPANDSIFTAGSNITLAASALETNGTIANISFYNGSTLLATSNMASSSYNYIWANVPTGTYSLTAVAVDANKVSGTSSPVTVTVTSSLASVIAITSPANDASFEAKSSIKITTSVLDSNGAINEVFFYDRTNFLGSTTVSPYTFIWPHVPAGTYSLTVEATDSNGGTLVSAPVNITVNPALNLATTPQK